MGDRHRSVLITVALCVFALINVVNAQGTCSEGILCQDIYQCPLALNILNLPKKTDAEIQLLRSLHCGFRDRTPLVCCPKVEPAHVTPVTAAPPKATQKCFTPDAQEGSCVNIRSCTHLTSLLQPPTKKENIAFVQNSKCQGDDQYSVCCGPSPPAIGTIARPSICTPSATASDPASQCCGVESGGGNRIVGGNVTAIDQYPWVTVTEYRKGDKIKLLCGGVLISSRYVMTAGHCVLGPVLEVGTPVNVRLGEYDTLNSGQDCVEVEGGGEDCTNGALIVPIEKVIPHPEYDPENKLRRHDLALLRLNQLAPYSDFIRPICLPAANIAVAAPPDLRLFAAGWGAVSTTESSSRFKLHVSLPYRTQEECQKPYTHPRRRVPLWRGQLCAGGEAGKDSCKGDSGGPLMRENGRNFEVVGIVSFGPTPCGLDQIPGVYTNVYEYLPWIRSEMKP